MSLRPGYELPPDKERLVRRAVRIEWLTIAYLLSAITFLYLTLGSSQALKAAFFEDILSLTPSIAFLVAARVRHRRPDEKFPYGYHRVVSIAYLCAALALLTLGAYILYDSVTKLLAFEHPPIGVITVFGRPVWLGWLMLPALVWSAVPAVFLGRAKLPLARDLHDKVLYASAEMNRADWLTAAAGMLGVIGVGFGLWWADGLAATIISLDIVRDGWTNVRNAIESLMDSRPTIYDHSKPDELPDRIEAELRSLDWVADVTVRLREEGHVFMGEALIVPRDDEDLAERLAWATRQVLALDWRLHEIVLAPAPRLEPVPEG